MSDVPDRHPELPDRRRDLADRHPDVPDRRRDLLDRRRFLVGAAALGVSAAGYTSVGALARRIRGIPVPPIRGPVIVRGAPDFLAAAHIYNERFDSVLPDAVARPLNAADVRTAVQWAVAHGVSLRARSGGHSYAGYSTENGGLVLDLRNLAGVSVDTRHGTATVGAGCQLIDVYSALASRRVTVPAGSCPSVGVSGHAMGGGMGLAGRQFGLTADNLLSAQIVTADGQLRTADSKTNPDLYWALRGGGGGNFGVVTSFTFRVHPVPATVGVFSVHWPWSRAEDALAAWQGWAPHATPAVGTSFGLEAGGGTALSMVGQYFGPSRDLPRLVAPLTAAGGTLVARDHDYLTAQLIFAGCSTKTLTECHTEGTRPGGILQRASFQAKSDYVAKPLPAAAREALVSAIEQRARQSGSGAILFDSYGGAINRVAASATAFVHRSVLFCIQYLTYNGSASWLDDIHGRMAPYVTGGAYVNYTDPDLKDWWTAYYGSNYARLLHVKDEYDSHRFFTFPQAIGRQGARPPRFTG